MRTVADDDAAVNSELPSVRPGGTTTDSYYGVWQRHRVTDSYPALHVTAGIMFEVCTCEWWGRRGGVPHAGVDDNLTLGNTFPLCKELLFYYED